MFNLKKKKIIYSISFVLLLLFISSIVPSSRKPFLDILKSPLNLLTLARREAGGLIFYHRNYIQNEKLNKEVGLLRQRMNSLQESSLENKRLKNLLNFKQKSSYKLIAARVIGRSPESWSSIAIIDKGNNSGIRSGMAVIAYQGLLGRIVETSDSTSKVMLINDPDFNVSALAQRSRQEGLVSGTLGNSLMMRYLPKDADIKASDVILTSGLTNVCPKGLTIGTVVDIGDEFSGLARYCVIKPAVNVSNIEEVLVIIE
ncbi:MAG: rod shape-determining protein MreC [Candidatus Omnitrophica bacterium]|nr:rod shape-determining protein MreC [Candidatus Omnitrophota bacterium]